MKRFDPRIVFGILLIFGGGLALAQSFGYLENVSQYFWGGAFVLGGLMFLSLLLGDNWWAAFPAFTLLGIGAIILLLSLFFDDLRFRIIKTKRRYFQHSNRFLSRHLK